MMPLAWNWLRRNLNLVLLMCAAICLSIALGKVIRGGVWSLLVPVSFTAVICGWGVGSSRLDTKQAWASLVALGIPLVFLYVSGLFPPLGRFIVALLALVPRFILWLSERTTVEIGPLVTAWTGMSSHAGGALIRFWFWFTALVNGNKIVDPLAVALAWNLLVWLAGAWSGWQLRRNRQALSALVPGGVLLALVIDYTRGEISLVILYLAILLALMGLSRNQWRLVGWQQRKVDYADSVVFETLLMVTLVTTGLVLSAAGMPSLSWRELLEKLRQEQRAGSSQVAESLGLEAPPNVANEPAFRSEGLPREHLLSLPPEQRKDVVLVVSTGELPQLPATALDVPAERYYWRAITYDVYTGAGWKSSPAQENEVPANMPLLELPQGYRVLKQHVVRASEENEYVYWTGLLAQTDTNFKVAWRAAPPEHPNPVSNGDMLGALATPDEFTVLSYVDQTDPGQLRNAGSAYPSAITGRYLRLPDTVPERVLGLAREITQAALTPYDRAVAIETYLRGFPYTLEVDRPPLSRDVVDYFLFTAQQGYCDYYASAMVVLARAVGLPARIVVGYSSGEYDPGRAVYVVRKENAHSWAEVYFSGYGWVEFEPTASQSAIHALDEENAAGPRPGLPARKQAFDWLKARWRELVTSLGGQLFIGLMGLLVFLVMWQLGEIGFLHLIPPQRAISRMYARLEKVASTLLPDLPRGHTPGQLSVALTRALKNAQGRWTGLFFSAAEEEIERVVRLYVAQSYSLHSPEQPQLKQGILSWSWLRWRLWVAGKWIQYFSRK